MSNPPIQDIKQAFFREALPSFGGAGRGFHPSFPEFPTIFCWENRLSFWLFERKNIFL
ncbi:hypothetical protein HMPREF6485_1577 [Segatella buccae ATCC 33574]|uniref:Uncharacterized protein n=1 Tax=Segatella buccae ATCC 33574 TaxID=873513 RepID=E6K7Z8_9BACT|nr:hypothetical protein HMPREF6485_1577 [Segatella buccae ATCC 33574]